MIELLPLDPAEFTPRFHAAAREAGFRLELLGEIQGHPLLACTKRTPGPRPRVYFSAGIHGNEPAPPWVLLKLVEEGFFDHRCTWFVCPLLNPAGFVHRSRENFGKIDLNRDYKEAKSDEIRAHLLWLRRQPNFDVTFCLHEDYDAHGFYLYELNPHQRPTLANVMLDAVSLVCPIEEDEMIDGWEAAARGIIRPVNNPLLDGNWPEAIYLRQHHPLNYTLETPSILPLKQRVAAHCAAVKAAIDRFCK